MKRSKRRREKAGGTDARYSSSFAPRNHRFSLVGSPLSPTSPHFIIMIGACTRRGSPLLLQLLWLCLSLVFFRPASALQAGWAPRRGSTTGCGAGLGPAASSRSRGSSGPAAGWTHYSTVATHLPAAAAAGGSAGAAAPKAPRKKAAATKKAASATPKTKASAKTTAAAAAVPPPPPPQPALESMKKAELIAAVAEKTGLSKKGAEDALTAFVQVIQDGVAANKKVPIPGFGTFAPRSRAARVGRNPQTGEELQIAASIAPAFTASKTWKDSLNNK